MKKVVLALAVVFSAALVSCGNKTAEAVDSDTVVAAVEEEVVTDSAATDSANADTVVTEVAAAEVAE